MSVTTSGGDLLHHGNRDRSGLTSQHAQDQMNLVSDSPLLEEDSKIACVRATNHPPPPMTCLTDLGYLLCDCVAVLTYEL